MITRNHLFKDFCNRPEISGLSDSQKIMFFNSTTNEQLAETFNLKVLRKGYFINK